MIKMPQIHDFFLNICIKTLCITSLVINTAYYSAYSAHNEGSLTRDPAENLFTSLFKKRRAEQLAAIKNMLAMNNYEKQHKMVALITEKAFSVIQSSRVTLENSGYVPGVSQFPNEEKTLDALANILENTALIGDLVLRLPEVCLKVLETQHEWIKLYQWSLAFANQTELLDKQTAKLMYLTSQELNITERDPDYVNPYRLKEDSTVDDAVSQPKKTTKERKRIKKGPRLSAGSLSGEL